MSFQSLVAWDFDLSALPLTPALSPEERETVIQRSSSRTRSVRLRLSAALPLLWGEGRGEGKAV